MARTDIGSKEILKEEKVGYLKSPLNLMQGTLVLTSDELILDAHKTGVGGFGILGAFIKKKVEEKSFGFNLTFSEIESFNKTSHGLQKNVLEIITRDSRSFKILVKKYEDWEMVLEKKISKS